MADLPHVGDTVQAVGGEGPDDTRTGKVLAVVRTPSVILRDGEGRTFVVPAETHRFDRLELT